MVSRPGHIDLLRSECVEEAQHVPGHVGHVVRNGPGRCTHTAADEQDDPAILGETVDQRRVPVVEVAAKVLQAQQRRSAGLLVPKRGYTSESPSISTERFSASGRLPYARA